MPPIVIYTKSDCGYCRAAKDRYCAKRTRPSRRSASTAIRPAQAAMAQKAGGRSTVPQIFIGETPVGGCDDLYELQGDGRLDALLAG